MNLFNYIKYSSVDITSVDDVLELPTELIDRWITKYFQINNGEPNLQAPKKTKCQYLANSNRDRFLVKALYIEALREYCLNESI